MKNMHVKKENNLRVRTCAKELKYNVQLNCCKNLKEKVICENIVSEKHTRNELSSLQINRLGH